MVKRGKDNWNKAMLVDPQGNPSRPNKKMRSSTAEKSVPIESNMRSKKDIHQTKTAKVEEPIKKTEDNVSKEEKNSTTTETSMNMRNTDIKSLRNKRSINVLGGKKNPEFSNPSRNRKQTPLDSFDVKAFFEENLYDIIDLEENRSGIREFEEAVKLDD